MININNFADFKEHELNEKLGVPEGNIESAKKIYKFIFDELEDYVYKGKVIDFKKLVSMSFFEDIHLNELMISSVQIIFKLTVKDIDRIRMTEMSVQLPIEIDVKRRVTKPTDITELSNAIINISLDVPEDINYEDIIEYIEENRSNFISSISHELKHIYDGSKRSNKISSIIQYGSYVNMQMPTKALGEFIRALYLINLTENLVRPSEFAAKMSDSGITKSKFKEFVNSESRYKEMKDLTKMTYEGMRLGIKEDLNFIKDCYRKENLYIPNNEEELIDDVLEVAYLNLIAKKMEMSKKILDYLIEPETEQDRTLVRDMISDFRKDFYKYKDDWESFYKDKIKMINNAAEKTTKKIVKLYDLAADETKNDIITKIHNKTKNVTESIYDWDAHYENNDIEPEKFGNKEEIKRKIEKN